MVITVDLNDVADLLLGRHKTGRASWPIEAPGLSVTHIYRGYNDIVLENNASPVKKKGFGRVVYSVNRLGAKIRIFD